MNIFQKQLLDLVKLAIHPEIEIPESLKVDSIDWKEVLEEAKKQSLMGVAFVGFKVWSASDYVKKSGANIDKRLLMQWVGICEKIREDNLLLNKRTSQVCKNFAKDGFRVSVMKGQGNALLYGEQLSLMRSSGDIDVWVEGGFEKVYNYVMKIAPTKEVNELAMSFNVFNDVLVGAHYLPNVLRHPLSNRRLQEFFSTKAEECFSNHVKLQTVNKEGEETWEDAVITTVPFNLVHQMAHIHRHLFTEGVGLRQVMDYYFQLLHAEPMMSGEERSEIVSVVKSLKLEKTAHALMWILKTYMGLPEKCLLWEPNKEDGEFLLDEIMRTGNFGRMDERRPEGHRIGTFASFVYVQKRNWRLSRFDRTDWFWGSLWRIYHFAWRRLHGFTH